MVKKVFSIITFVLSLLVFLALCALTFELVKELNYINSLPTASGSDYLGILFYRMFYCVTALPGIVTSSICIKLSQQKPIKIVCFVLLAIFSVVFVVFGLAWLKLL